MHHYTGLNDYVYQNNLLIATAFRSSGPLIQIGYYFRVRLTLTDIDIMVRRTDDGLLLFVAKNVHTHECYAAIDLLFAHCWMGLIPPR